MRRMFVAILAAASLVGCGGDGSPTRVQTPTPTPIPTPTPPSRADITIAQTGLANLCISNSPEFFFGLAIPIRIEERAGVGAAINFLRLSLYVGGVEVERSEIGADVVSDFFDGSNRLPPNGTKEADVGFRFNDDNFEAVALYGNFTDDRGNVLDVDIELDDVGTTIFCPPPLFRQ